MAVSTIFAYIFLGLSVVLYLIGAYLSLRRSTQQAEPETQELIDDIAKVLEQLQKTLDALGKLGIGVQFAVFGTITAAIGIYLLTL